MALPKRAEVFRKKVLEKLFPAPPAAVSSHLESSILLKTSFSELGQEGDVNPTASQGYSSSPAQNNMILPSRKIYTASPPPDDYIPASTNDTTHESMEGDDSDSDADGPENGQGQPQRKRHRRKRRKNGLQNSANLQRGPAECEEPTNLTEGKLQLERSEGPNVSRNKRRKMKKKRHKEKMRAAGLLTKPAAMDFVYKPETEGRTDFEEAHEKVNDILDFLQATQEMYFLEKRESAVSSQSVCEVLQRLESHSMSSSDVTLLHRMKCLVLLQDVERIKGVVEEFQAGTVMPPDYAKAISSLFLYWVTDILPGKDRKKDESTCPSVST